MQEPVGFHAARNGESAPRGKPGQQANVREGRQVQREKPRTETREGLKDPAVEGCPVGSPAFAPSPDRPPLPRSRPGASGPGRQSLAFRVRPRRTSHPPVVQQTSRDVPPGFQVPSSRAVRSRTKIIAIGKKSVKLARSARS